MYLTYRYSLPCLNDIPSCYKYIAIQKQTKNASGKLPLLAIWNTMTSSMVARAFLLAYRIMGKIVESNGDTDCRLAEKRSTS